MDQDKARAILENNFGEFNGDVQALYTLLLAAEERIRGLQGWNQALEDRIEKHRRELAALEERVDQPDWRQRR